MGGAAAPAPGWRRARSGRHAGTARHRAGAGQRDADSGRGFDDAGGDLDRPQAESGKLGCSECESGSKAKPYLLVLTYSKMMPKAVRVIEIGAERNPQPICDSRFVPTTCGRNERGPALDADPHSCPQCSRKWRKMLKEKLPK